MPASRESRVGAASPDEYEPLLRGRETYYRELAGNLRSLEDPPGSVLVAGAEERVGCSSVCLGLGGALASLGVRAAVVDCNLQRPRLHRMIGEPNFTGLTTALETGEEPEGCGYEPVPGLFVMPTGPIPENPASAPETSRLAGLVGALREEREVVLLDAPRCGEMEEHPGLAAAFDGVLLVVHASRTAKKAARDAADSLAEAGASLLGVVLNGRP